MQEKKVLGQISSGIKFALCRSAVAPSHVIERIGMPILDGDRSTTNDECRGNGRCVVVSFVSGRRVLLHVSLLEPRYNRSLLALQAIIKRGSKGTAYYPH